MTRPNQLAPRTTVTSGQRLREAVQRSGREARMRRTVDGVVAS